MAKNQEREARWHELMCRTQSGDNEGYRQLLEELQGFIRGYCRKFSREEAELDEYVQESLLAIHRARFSFDSHQQFMPWLVTVVRHRAIDRLRKQARRMEREVLSETAVGQFQTSRSVKSIEGAIAINELLNDLKDIYREPIRLTRLEGYTEKEAATKLQLTEGTVKMRIHRGLKDLKKAVRREISLIEGGFRNE